MTEQTKREDNMIAFTTAVKGLRETHSPKEVEQIVALHFPHVSLLEVASEEISDPIIFMRAALTVGEQLDGTQAQDLSRDPNCLKDIIESALTLYKGE